MMSPLNYGYRHWPSSYYCPEFCDYDVIIIIVHNEYCFPLHSSGMYTSQCLELFFDAILGKNYMKDWISYY